MVLMRSPHILKNLPKKAIIILFMHIFNEIIRNEFILEQWKMTQVIVLLKPDKQPERATSYKPISLLSIM